MRRPLLALFLLLVGSHVHAQIVTVNGQVRHRSEYDDKGLTETGDADLFHLLRTRLGVTARPSEHVSAFIQIQDARKFGEEGDLQTVSTLDGSADQLDFHQAYLEVDVPGVKGLSARVGRQELAYGNERLVGSIGWSNVGQAFDGAVLKLDHSRGAADLFAMQLRAPDDVPGSQNLFGLYTSWAIGEDHAVEVVTEYDRSALIGRAVHTLTTKIWQELLVVAFIVLIFLLHVRSAFVALVTVPIGILMSLGVMYLLGINANIMSLGGIAIAIGVMVDASLVMVENAHKHIERLTAAKGEGASLTDGERIHAVIEAAKEVGPSLFFSLLIVTVSFLPVFTLEQVEGRLFRPLAFAKTFSMAAASILAVTLVPALMVTFVKGRIRSEAENPVARFFIWVYRPLIRKTLRYPVVVLCIAFGLLLATALPVQQMLVGRTVIPFPQIGSEFMPPLWEGDLLYMPTTLPGVSPQEAKEILQRTDRIIASFPEVERVFGKIGRAETATDPAPLSMIETIVILKPEDEWREGLTRQDLIGELNRAVDLPGLTNAWTMPIKTRIDMLATGIKTPVGIKIAGPDLTILERLGREVEAAVRDLPGTRSAFAERVMGGSFLDIEVDRFAAARSGLTSGDVQDVLQ
ncbi:MAG: efflux RND transporter permease subunit, partial [Bacteroidetes bacterium]|nr:efflux RND transporter permease subunit [Bacteroidota bacterium]